MDVLVLNATYEPLNRVDMQRAIRLVLREKAEIVTERGIIRTVSMSFPMPSVIRMLAFIRRPRRTVALTKKNLFHRDKHTCQYCGSTQRLTVDHVVPRSQGGKTIWKNVVAACDPCNARKKNHTPAQAGMTLLRTPREPHYVAWINLKAGVPKDWHEFFFDASIEERISA